MPPTRFRVVERGRRLEVIDTQADAGAGEPAAAREAVGPATSRSVPAWAGLTSGRALSRAPAAEGAWPRKMRFDGTREWTTHPAYDLNGPRRVRMGPLATQALGIAVIAAVVLLLAATVLVGPAMLIVAATIAAAAGKNGKPWLTRRLDRMVVE